MDVTDRKSVLSNLNDIIRVENADVKPEIINKMADLPFQFHLFQVFIFFP